MNTTSVEEEIILRENQPTESSRWNKCIQNVSSFIVLVLLIMLFYRLYGYIAENIYYMSPDQEDKVCIMTSKPVPGIVYPGIFGPKCTCTFSMVWDGIVQERSFCNNGELCQVGHENYAFECCVDNSRFFEFNVGHCRETLSCFVVFIIVFLACCCCAGLG
jgi:hypothetical protein